MISLSFFSITYLLLFRYRQRRSVQNSAVAKRRVSRGGRVERRARRACTCSCALATSRRTLPRHRPPPPTAASKTLRTQVHCISKQQRRSIQNSTGANWRVARCGRVERTQCLSVLLRSRDVSPRSTSPLTTASDSCL